jgi:general secretion pathway protein B
MSFILDALKKSEAERARKSGPTLVDMRIVAPRRGVPAWVMVLGLVLLANLVVLAIVLARGGRATRVVPATEVAAAVPAPAPPPQEPRATNVLPPPVLPAPSTAAAPSQATVLPPVVYGGAPTNVEALPPGGQLIKPATGVPPAPETSAPVRTPSLQRQDSAGLPTAEDLRISGITLPQLNMALHAWDAQPGNRYVMINGQKLREGQPTAEGVMVEQITADGAVMRWQERRFIVTPGN